MDRRTLTARLDAVMLADARRIGHRLRRARNDAELAKLALEIDRAEARVARRRDSLPAPRYPSELPITARHDEILATIRDHQVVVIAGETGSGKTTQLPKMCLELGRGVRGMVGHTQPRRLAARTVAARIADELDTDVGQTVGYAVRFTDRVSDATLVKVMTDGILLSELHRDRSLLAYDTIIVDEAHERSLNIDFLLGYLTELLPRRPELKVIITSATIDTEKFAAHFGGAPIVEVSGRSHPVEIRYRPLEDDADQVQAIEDAVAEVSREGPGDVLVFLSGEREIRDAAEWLGRNAEDNTEILPLYARLSVAEQQRVFAPHPGRRIVLATNVAETSLTVPGIRTVVDVGTARISRFNRRTKVQRLPIERISKASANQRAGRCGRVAPGVCIRLYSEEDFDSRPEFTEPEILRTNLASVILQMLALDLGDVATFGFVDPPDVRTIRDGMAMLEEVGALSAGEGPPRLTALGRRLARLPVDPRYGRMLIEAEHEGAVAELLVITAALSIQDPRERPTELRATADAMHARFADAGSDFVSILNLWRYLRDRQADLTSNQFRKLCRSEFLNYLRIREWQDVHAQLAAAVDEIGLDVNASPAPTQHIHRAALAGLLSHIGMRDPGRPEYRGARDARFAIAPGSALSRGGPRWVMAAELVETNRMWARVVAPIDPAWAERLGGHLVRRSFGEPRWDRRRGTAVTDERVSLFGLPIVTARRTDYTRVDPAVARQLFIEHALMRRESDRQFEFLARNDGVVAEAHALEVKSRRPLFAGDEAVRSFYDARIDTDATSVRAFERWWARARAEDRHRLEMQLTDVVVSDGAHLDPEAFPDSWGGLGLTYVLDPGADDDGVSVDIPLAVLATVDGAAFTWHIPAWRADMITALLRLLPREYRRDLSPAPEHAAAFLAHCPPGPTSVTSALSAFFGVPARAWRTDALPAHLRMHFRVVDDEGVVIAVGADLAAIQRSLHVESRTALAQALGWRDRTGQRSWTFGTIPRAVDGAVAGHPVRAYPSLVDEGETVGVTVWATVAEQAREAWAGTARLILLTVPVMTAAARRALSKEARLAVAEAGYATIEELLDDCAVATVDRVMTSAGGPVWDEAAFAALAAAARRDGPETGAAVVSFVGGILVAARHIRARLARLTAPATAEAVDDIHAQLDALVHRHFAQATGAARLPDVLRYLRAVNRRLDKLPEDPVRDAQKMERIRTLTDAYRAALRSSTATAAQGQEVRWMLEELRVSEFAQMLGTAYPVSVQRVRRAISALA